MSLRTRDRMVALVATVLIASLPAHAQQPKQEPQAQPQEPQSPSQLPAQSRSQDSKEQAVGKRGGASYAQPVAVTPHASPAPQSLQAAIAKGDNAGALKMIERGIDIEAKDPGTGATALHYAVMKGEMPLVGLLVQRGAR